MGHALVKGLTIPKVVQMIAEEKNIDELTALELFYTSPIGSAYSDDETGLYAQSALYIYSLFTKSDPCSKVN